MSDINNIAWIWASLLGKPNSEIRSVIKKNCGSIENALYMAEKKDSFDMIENARLRERIKDISIITRAKQIVSDCERNNINIVTVCNEKYPENLRHIPNKPAVLYYKGHLPEQGAELFISIVGSRRCSPYGRITCYSFSKDLAKSGFGIVSGMARGIDTEAHKGALHSGGYTIAVLGSGPDVIYPKENIKLYDEIIEKGCVVSELPPGSPPAKSHFPARNRIISGLSKALLVVEAARKSGAMITVNTALEQDRCIYAVPGNINSENSAGCNDLIKTGACCVTSYTDILKDFNISDISGAESDMCGWINGLSGAEAAAASGILNGCYTVNEISIFSDRSVSSILSALTILEIKGIVTKGLDGTYKLLK